MTYVPRGLTVACAALALASLTACATSSPPGYSTYPSHQQPGYQQPGYGAEFGRVSSIQIVQVPQGGQTSGAGAVVGAVAVAVGGPGKKVAWRPLCTCHLSHSKTREKPNITHRMVRRMSFMKTSLQRKVDGEARQHQRGQAPWPSGETAPGPAQARDHGRLRTRDGSVQCGAA